MCESGNERVSVHVSGRGYVTTIVSGTLISETSATTVGVWSIRPTSSRVVSRLFCLFRVTQVYLSRHRGTPRQVHCVCPVPNGSTRTGTGQHTLRTTDPWSKVSVTLLFSQFFSILLLLSGSLFCSTVEMSPSF